MSYLPEVAWSTIANNVSLGLTSYRYYITVNPLDPNEAGASTMSMAVNDWFIDFAGYPFLIEEINGSILTVYDILERGDGTTSAYGPYANKLGYVYRPLNGAIILTQAQLRKLDESAKDIIQPIEKGIQWAYRGIRLVSVDDDYSNITRLDLTNNLKYTYTENGGWQGGNKAELDLNIGLGTGALAEMEYTNNGDGTITVQDNTFMMYDNVNGIGYPKPYLISGGTFSFTDNTYNYIVADYNSGTPIMYVITDVTLINETTIVPVFSVLRRGTILCLTNWNTLGNAKIDKLHQSIVKTQRYRRQSGLAISVPSTGTPRRVSITGGIVWIGAVPVDLNATISGDAGVYMFEYYKSSSTWTYTLVSQINNTYYQGTTDRVELTSNRYAVAFIFRGVEHYNNHIYLVYGTGDYTLAQAQAASVPSDLPIAIRSHTILIGRVIIQKSSDTITELASAFDTVFTIQPIDNHAGLSNLGWTVSGHTATAGSVPAFNSLGVAIEASLTNGYVPYKTTNGLDNSLISINGTDVTIGTLNGLLLGTSGLLSTLSSLNITYGGTGITSYTQGDLLYYSSGNSLSKLNKSTSANYYLKNSGVDNNPAWASITDADLVLSDITTNNASSSKHGFVPKLPNDTSKWFRGDGSWATISTDYGNFLDSVIRMVVNNSFDPSPITTGDRYILETTSLHANFGTITGLGVHDIVQYNGSAFTVVFDASAATSPATVTVGIDKNGASNHDWTYNVTDDIWIDRGTTTLHNSLSDLNTGVGQYYHLTSEQRDLVAGITSSFTELNYLDGTTVTDGKIIFGDGTKLTSDTNLHWDNVNKFLSIGTSSPLSPLHVVRNSSASNEYVARFEQTNPNQSCLVRYYNDVGNYAELVYGRSSATTNPNKLQFNIRTADTGSVTALTVDKTGNVGIGTTAPALKSHILATTSSNPATSGTIQTGGILRLGNSDTNAILDIGVNGGSGAWLQVTNKSDLSLKYPLLLNPIGGNVGIGTTSPISKLHIVGSSVPNFDKDDYSTAIIEDMDSRLELVASDSGSNAASFILNTVAGPNDNRKWFFGAGTSADSNKLHIGYSTSLTDVNPAASSMFVMTTGGNVGIGRTPTTYRCEIEGSSLITNKLYLGTSTAPTIDTGTLNALVWDNTTGEVKQRAISGGSGTPGGSDTYVQFNDGGAFGGVNNFRFSKSVGTVTITPTNYVNTGLYINTSNVPFILKGQSTNYFRYAIVSSAFRIDGDSSDGFSTYKSIIVGDYAGGCDLYYNGSKKAETETYGFLITGYGKAEGFVKPYQALTSSTSVTMNVRSGQNAKITLGHNVTLTLSNLVDGDEGNIVVKQDTTGGRTLTISPTPKVINAGGGTLTLTGTANSTDILSYTYTNSILYITYGLNYT